MAERRSHARELAHRQAREAERLTQEAQAAREAERLGHPLETELKILLLHGVLHLAGWDHETDSGEMSAEEETLRVELGLEQGLIGRVHGAGNSAKTHVAKSVRGAPGSVVVKRAGRGAKR